MCILYSCLPEVKDISFTPVEVRVSGDTIFYSVERSLYVVAPSVFYAGGIVENRFVGRDNAAVVKFVSLPRLLPLDSEGSLA